MPRAHSGEGAGSLPRLMPAATPVRFGPPLLLDEAFTHRERAMAELPTVRIVNPSNPDEFITINESDYDPDAHELWEERGEASEPGPEDMTVAELEDALDEVGIDPEELEGSGSGGNVVKADLVAALVGAREGDEG